jgi:hypothetical protein
LKPLNLKSQLKETQMARGMSGIQMGKEPHGIEMKIPIQSGNVSKRETIEASIKIARLMI